jgi:hypothetical protein
MQRHSSTRLHSIFHSLRLPNWVNGGATLVFLLIVTILGGCKTARKTTPELSRLEGKRVALVEVEGEETSRKIAEVALVNQLIKNGSFILISKQEIELARKAPEQDPMDWKGISRRAGADYALKTKVLKFDADVHEGYSEEIVDDSQMAEERGEEGRRVKRLYKVKAMKGAVQFQMDFTGVSEGSLQESRSGIAEASEEVKVEWNRAATHLPPKLRFLETLSNRAFEDFFKKYQ